MDPNFFDASGTGRAPALIVELRADAAVLHVFGELDFAAVPELRSALADIAGPGRELVVDLTRCTYIEACALGVLTRARSALQGRLRIEVADDTIVQRVFEITGVAHDVTFEPSLGRSAVARPSTFNPLRRMSAGTRRPPPPQGARDR
jgi:anti-anti-sigma factor